MGRDYGRKSSVASKVQSFVEDIWLVDGTRQKRVYFNTRCYSR